MLSQDEVELVNLAHDELIGSRNAVKTEDFDSHDMDSHECTIEAMQESFDFIID